VTRRKISTTPRNNEQRLKISWDTVPEYYQVFLALGRLMATMQSAMNSEPLSSEDNSAGTLGDVEITEDSGDQTTETKVWKRVRKPTTGYDGFWHHRDDVS
jgi:hypothetical protein